MRSMAWSGFIVVGLCAGCSSLGSTEDASTSNGDAHSIATSDARTNGDAEMQQPPQDSGPLATTPGCNLPGAAFCETFSTISAGGRGGDLDEARWSVGRVTNQENGGQGVILGYPAAVGLICGQVVRGIFPPNDYAICTDAQGPHLTQTAYDAGGTVVSSFRARQPFDFAGRTGVITFDLGGRVAGGHGFWPEILIESEPTPTPYQDLPGLTPFPRNAIGIELSKQPACAYGMDSSRQYLVNGVGLLKIIREYEVDSLGPPELHAQYDGSDSEPPCFSVSDTAMSHYELRLSQDSIELWVTDPGAPHDTLRMVLQKTGIHLPFTRGYVNFQTAHYHAGKDDTALLTTPMTFNWGSIGFDGPVIAADRTYEIQNGAEHWIAPSNCQEESGSCHMVSIGYELPRASAVSFPIAGVDLTGASDASINLNAFNFPANAVLSYRFNGGAWQDYTSTVSGGLDQRSLHIPIALSLLNTGNNMLEMKGTDAIVGNVDVTVR